MTDKPVGEFEKAIGGRSGGNLLSEIWYLLRQNKKWWLLPILMVLLSMGLGLVLSGTAAAPFIYALF